MKICKKKLMNFKKKLAMALDRETIFCKDLNDLAKKLNEDNNNHKYVTGRNYDILNYENVNDFDKLNGPQRTAVKNIFYESPLYLNNLNTDKKSPYAYLDKISSDFKDIVLKNIVPIASECSDLFKELNPNVYVVAPKKYMINNKEREVDFENEKVHYINSNGKLVVIGKEEINMKNKTETNFKKTKDYLIPKNITIVYIVQTKKEENLNFVIWKSQSFCGI
ncbi:hypothetical protein BCR36DRAFT_412083 [Piromyces finnis]|uniref:Uncharacterized protein n=1 Tax=Piromyces finnis TaxID=1754191 RepID=A0A1Y1VCC2_9FUNG|nr:hypothetical protein BCR36DRAFT_412083 [Piromyces finnis]|eukprot:ORX51102.1 hypothetical protein BCR36DRAFT_412083 [Piromyces finnis]